MTFVEEVLMGLATRDKAATGTTGRYEESGDEEQAG